MKSEMFNRFYDSYFGDPFDAWHDGLDEQALASLEGEEREEAERLLKEGLSSGDSRMAAGLRVLESRSSVSALKKKLSDATGTERIEMARALWELEEWPPAADILIDELKNGAHWSRQADAAKAMMRGKVNTKAAIKALTEALDDEERVVRSDAAEALIEILELPAKEHKYGSYQVVIDVMSEDEQKRKEAVEQVKRLVSEKQG